MESQIKEKMWLVYFLYFYDFSTSCRDKQYNKLFNSIKYRAMFFLYTISINLQWLNCSLLQFTIYKTTVRTDFQHVCPPPPPHPHILAHRNTHNVFYARKETVNFSRSLKIKLIFFNLYLSAPLSPYDRFSVIA